MEERSARPRAAFDIRQKAGMKAASTAHVYRFPSADMLHASQDWRARANRAIASRILYTDVMLRAQGERLALVRYRLTVRAASMRGADTHEWQRFGRQVADYYRAHGRLLNGAKRLREDVARYTGCSLHQER